MLYLNCPWPYAFVPAMGFYLVIPTPGLPEAEGENVYLQKPRMSAALLREHKILFENGSFHYICSHWLAGCVCV